MAVAPMAFGLGVEKVWHINVLELKAIYFSLKALMADTSDTHLLIMCDNTTAVHTINKMGTCRSIQCHDVVMDIWELHHWLK